MAYEKQVVVRVNRLKNRRIQFSLRSYLFALCLLGCVLAYCANIKRRQAEVLALVSELGGHVSHVNFHDHRVIEPSRSSFLPDWFYIVLPERYNYVYLPYPEVDDAKLARILMLPGIEGLNISRSSITDEGLRMLQKKSGLKEIQVYDIPTVSEEAILQLKASTCSSI